MGAMVAMVRFFLSYPFKISWISSLEIMLITLYIMTYENIGLA